MRRYPMPLRLNRLSWSRIGCVADRNREQSSEPTASTVNRGSDMYIGLGTLLLIIILLLLLT
jgi:hypothetical protein